MRLQFDGCILQLRLYLLFALVQTIVLCHQLLHLSFQSFDILVQTLLALLQLLGQIGILLGLLLDLLHLRCDLCEFTFEIALGFLILLELFLQRLLLGFDLTQLRAESQFLACLLLEQLLCLRQLRFHIACRLHRCRCLQFGLLQLIGNVLGLLLQLGAFLLQLGTCAFNLGKLHLQFRDLRLGLLATTIVLLSRTVHTAQLCGQISILCLQGALGLLQHRLGLAKILQLIIDAVQLLRVLVTHLSQHTLMVNALLLERLLQHGQLLFTLGAQFLLSCG